MLHSSLLRSLDNTERVLGSTALDSDVPAIVGRVPPCAAVLIETLRAYGVRRVQHE